MDRLRLEVREFETPLRWRWLLSEECTGAPLADHQVDLTDRPGEFEAFTDLYRYLRWNTAPDRRTAGETEMAAQVGAWAGSAVLGQRVCDAIVAAAPVTVRVMVPEQGGFLLSWPLELAHADGQPLAAHGDVTLAYDLAPGSVAPGPVAGPGSTAEGRGLRMLAVFSLPTATSVLALRRERFELARLIRQIAARQRRRVELAIVQYGATRQKLAAMAEAGDGWDVLHLSGHGGRGQFLLEKADGSPDPVDTAELMKLLARLRRRVKLAVVSACESAAATTAETLRWVGLEEQAQVFEQQAEQDIGTLAAAGSGVEPVMTGVARAVAARLGCAVVAMRYPVVDDFAIAFAQELYERLLGVRDDLPASRGQPLASALAAAVTQAAGPEPTPARPVLSVATPVLLLGGQAAELVLEVPRGQPGLDPALVAMQEFPPEPERFVGRAQAMARASTALASGSGQTAVLLHGMAGSGKTACALELAYRHQDSFAAAAFWQAPLTDDEFSGALASLAAQLEVQLGEYGFAMADKITTAESLARFAPRLRRLLEGTGILLVLDNLETLLTPAGTWRDPRWEPLIGALTSHDGESRVILTSRIPPAGLGTNALPLPVHALDLAESVALARELPGLRGLLHADAGPVRDFDEAILAADRDLVRRVLHVVQGHPKLMELADAAATAGPSQLSTQLAAAETAAGGQALDAFFRDGATTLDGAQFLDAFTTWTTTTLGQLAAPARLMAQFLACLEENDRASFIVDANWADLWHRLNQPGDPPDPAALLIAITAAALLQPDVPLDTGQGDSAPVTYRMHPGVAQAIRADAGTEFPVAVDTELAATWLEVSSQAQRREGGEAGQAIVHAGLAATPYLLRLHEWRAAGAVLEAALARDRSPATTQAALPSLRAIADATHDARDLGVLARTLGRVDPYEAEALMRDALTQSVSDGDFGLASAAAGDLVNLLRDAGRLREALHLAGQMAEYGHQAGHGPWSEIANQGMQLQILGMMGQHQHVLDEVQRLQGHMDTLPTTKADNDPVNLWNIRESILDIGRSSALALREWQQALDLNAANIASKGVRGAGAYEIALRRRNDAFPLIRLGRFAEAERILIECQQAFEEHSDLDQLGRVFSARADLEAARGNLSSALAFQRTTIRFAYTRSDPRVVAIAHGNLASYLRKVGSDSASQRAHLLAAALLYQLSGMTHNFDDAATALAVDVRRDAGHRDLPGSVDEVIRVAEQTEGVHLGQLLTTLLPDRQAIADALAGMLQAAAGSGSGQDPTIQGYLRRWEPMIAAAVAAAGGNADATAHITQALDQLAHDQHWAALTAVLRRIIDGDRDGSLLDGLDPVDAAIASQVLTRLAQLPDTRAEERP
jgi:tetratricopeptide (TPR) repeat protein